MNPDRLRGSDLDAAWNFADPDASLMSLTGMRDRIGATTVAGNEVTTQIARAEGLRGNLAIAHDLLDSLTSTDNVLRTRIALERGRLFNSGGDPTAAHPWFFDAVSLARSSKDSFLEVDALHMLAIVDADGAESWTNQALEITEASTDPRVQRWAGPLSNNLGWTLHDAGRYDEALVAFEAALTAHQAFGTPEQVQIAHWTIARCLRSLGRLDEALAIQVRLQRDGTPDEFVDQEIAILRDLLNNDTTHD